MKDFIDYMTIYYLPRLQIMGDMYNLKFYSKNRNGNAGAAELAVYIERIKDTLEHLCNIDNSDLRDFFIKYYGEDIGREKYLKKIIELIQMEINFNSLTDDRLSLLDRVLKATFAGIQYPKKKTLEEVKEIISKHQLNKGV
jgi:hypothetical protein